MKNFKRIYIASVLLLSGAVGFAAETFYNASASTFLDVAERIVDGNEALKAEDATLQAEIEALRAEAVPENPEVEFEHLWSAGEADNKWNIGVTQSLPWPGTFGARRKAASLLAEARTSGMEQSRRELRLRVLQSLADIVAANRRVEILSELHRSMIELREAYERAWQHGETTILDLNKMKIETVRSLSELQQAESQRQTLIHELQALAGNSGDPAETALTLTDFPLLELAPLDAYLAGVDRSPEIEYLRAMQAVERQNVAVAKASRLPGISLGYRHALEEGTHFNGLAVGITLPVYSRRSAVASARSRALASDYSELARRREIEQTIASDYAAAASVREQIAGYAPVVENVNNQALLRRALDGGQISLLDYLQETSYFLRARLDYVDLSATYARLLFSLSRYF